MNQKQQLFWISIVVIGTILWVCTMTISTAWANAKLSDLERKIADLSLLNQQLKDRMDQATTIRSALAEEQGQLAAEIKVLLKSLHIKSFQRAMQEQRIRYNIELLRTTVTYIQRIDEKMSFYQAGRDRLSYLQSLAQDDIRMIATLSDLKTDALTTQISLVINRYLPDAHTIQIDPDRIDLVTAQSVWESLVGGHI